MSKLTRDVTAVPVSRYIIILGANAPDRRKYYFPYSADHVQDCSPYYPAQLINIYSFYMCDLYIIYLYAYILFAIYVCMLVYCVNYYIYNRGISGIHFLWRQFNEKPFGGIVANSLSRDLFSKTLLSENFSKTPLQPKKTSPRMGWITFSLQSFRQG